jgi:hypothetical protein
MINFISQEYGVRLMKIKFKKNILLSNKEIQEFYNKKFIKLIEEKILYNQKDQRTEQETKIIENFVEEIKEEVIKESEPKKTSKENITKSNFISQKSEEKIEEPSEEAKKTILGINEKPKIKSKDNTHLEEQAKLLMYNFIKLNKQELGIEEYNFGNGWVNKNKRTAIKMVDMKNDLDYWNKVIIFAMNDKWLSDKMTNDLKGIMDCSLRYQKSKKTIKEKNKHPFEFYTESKIRLGIYDLKNELPNKKYDSYYDHLGLREEYVTEFNLQRSLVRISEEMFNEGWDNSSCVEQPSGLKRLLWWKSEGMYNSIGTN